MKFEDLDHRVSTPGDPSSQWFRAVTTHTVSLPTSGTVADLIEVFDAVRQEFGLTDEEIGFEVFEWECELHWDVPLSEGAIEVLRRAEREREIAALNDQIERATKRLEALL